LFFWFYPSRISNWWGKTEVWHTTCQGTARFSSEPPLAPPSIRSILILQCTGMPWYRHAIVSAPRTTRGYQQPLGLVPHSELMVPYATASKMPLNHRRVCLAIPNCRLLVTFKQISDCRILIAT
jgi:hypothetical protein